MAFSVSVPATRATVPATPATGLTENATEDQLVSGGRFRRSEAVSGLERGELWIFSGGSGVLKWKSSSEEEEG